MTRQEIFFHAHAAKRANPYMTLSQALRAAWAASRIQSAPEKAGIFEYTKATGELRRALAGKAPAGSVKGADRPRKWGVVTYFDLGVQEFRAFRVDRLVSAPGFHA